MFRRGGPGIMKRCIQPEIVPSHYPSELTLPRRSRVGGRSRTGLMPNLEARIFAGRRMRIAPFVANIVEEALADLRQEGIQLELLALGHKLDPAIGQI